MARFMRSFTNDSKHPLNRIYERLRKRSYRTTSHSYMVNRGGNLRHAMHASYLRGVCDALKAVEEEDLVDYR